MSLLCLSPVTEFNPQPPIFSRIFRRCSPNWFSWPTLEECDRRGLRSPSFPHRNAIAYSYHINRLSRNLHHFEIAPKFAPIDPIAIAFPLRAWMEAPTVPSPGSDLPNGFVLRVTRARGSKRGIALRSLPFRHGGDAPFESRVRTRSPLFPEAVGFRSSSRARHSSYSRSHPASFRFLLLTCHETFSFP
jgi:hypothetical protein